MGHKLRSVAAVEPSAARKIEPPLSSMRRILARLAVPVSAFVALSAFAADPIPVRVTIDAAKPAHSVSPMLHGIFFEDINYGADGGLYAELVQNRSFEHLENLYAWGTVNRGGDGEVTIGSEAPVHPKNPRYARLTIRDAGKGFGVANYGYGGITLAGGDTYLISLRARGEVKTAAGAAALTVVLEDDTGRPLGTCKFEAVSGEWQKLEGEIKASGPAISGRIAVLAGGPGQVDLDVISLFPQKTFKGRRNGVRADLAQMLADLKPAFFRFPGGCIVEGMDLPNRYQWKDSIGDIATRPENWNRWQTAIRNQTAPQYYQTYGLGFFEYFQLCEDLGAEAVPIVNCGMACQYQSKQLVPLDQLDPFVQDALDLIEFANGPVTSTWGAKRAEMGHPEPFNLKYLGVGNEQWGEEYFLRYKVFHDAIKAKYPEIQIITTAGPGVDDGSWKLAWDKFRSGTPAEIVDEHYYRPPQWFLENHSRYDDFPRNGPKVFAGEYAAHERNRRATLRAAIAEAAYLTGILRNSDLVTMSCYAPLFARANAVQWQPDLIWFDNTRVYGTASYHVQKLYSTNRPDRYVPATVEGPDVQLPRLPVKEVSTYGATPLEPYHPGKLPAIYVAAGLDDETQELVMFLVNPWSEPRAATLNLGGVAPDATVRAWVLSGETADDANTFDEPRNLAPKEVSVGLGTVTVAPQSLMVLRTPTR